MPILNMLTMPNWNRRSRCIPPGEHLNGFFMMPLSLVTGLALLDQATATRVDQARSILGIVNLDHTVV